MKQKLEEYRKPDLYILTPIIFIFLTAIAILFGMYKAIMEIINLF